jgi:hypothetical protein
MPTIGCLGEGNGELMIRTRKKQKKNDKLEIREQKPGKWVVRFPRQTFTDIKTHFLTFISNRRFVVHVSLSSCLFREEPNESKFHFRPSRSPSLLK